MKKVNLKLDSDEITFRPATLADREAISKVVGFPFSAVSSMLLVMNEFTKRLNDAGYSVTIKTQEKS